jgi:type I restriction enzyme S subunit
MQSDWRDVTLGEFVRLQRGHDLTASEQRPGHFPVMGSAGPNGTHAEFKALGPGVVIGRSGASMGRVHYCETDYWPHNTCMYVTDFLGNNPLFAFYKLAELDLARYNSGSAQPSLNRNYIYGMSLRIPSRRIQDKIVDVVHSIDKKVDVNRRINHTLEAMVQAIFKSWFVDFDPVKAKIAALQEGQDPLRAAMIAISGKSDAELDALAPEQYEQLAATAALFPDEMEESELGEIPKGWAVRAADSLTEVGIGKTPPRKEPQWFTEGRGDWRWVSIKDMGASGVFQQRSSEFLTSEAVSRFNVRVVPDRTVLLSFKLTIGRVAITDGPMVTNEAIAHFKLTSDTSISSEYLYLYLKGFDYSTLGSTSSIADAVNSKTIRDLPITVASRALIDRFTKSITPFFEELRNRQNEIASLGATRDALLPKLLSGEIEVAA